MFSNRNKHMEIAKRDITFPTLYVYAAVSKEYGIEIFRLTGQHPNGLGYQEVLEDIAAHGTDCVILADNASWHKSHAMRAVLRHLDLIQVENIQYARN